MNGLDGSTEIDADGLSARADVADERGDQARLADARRPGDADDVRGARLRVDLADELVRERVAVLDERDRPGERAPVALAHAGGERLAASTRGVAPCSGAGLHYAALDHGAAPDPAREPVAHERGHRGQTAPRRPRPSARRTRPSAGRRGHPEPEHRVVRAHQHGEHAPAHRVGRPTLDEHRVTDDGRLRCRRPRR